MDVEASGTAHACLWFRKSWSADRKVESNEKRQSAHVLSESLIFLDWPYIAGEWRAFIISAHPLSREIILNSVKTFIKKYRHVPNESMHAVQGWH